MDADGRDTSPGTVGLKGGFLSRWFRLPWVPLLGAGFRPRRSEMGWIRERLIKEPDRGGGSFRTSF